MNDLLDRTGAVLEKLYGRYLMKDVMGKAVPGFFFIAAVIMALTSPATVMRLMVEAKWYHWLIVALPGWVFGFAIQGLGEKSRYVQSWPIKHYGNARIGEYYALYFRCEAEATAEERNQIDRFAAIHEAAGNSSLALALSILVVAADVVVELRSSLPGSYGDEAADLVPAAAGTAALALSSVFLHWSNRVHVERRYQILKSVEARLPAKPPVPTASGTPTK